MGETFFKILFSILFNKISLYLQLAGTLVIAWIYSARMIDAIDNGPKLTCWEYEFYAINHFVEYWPADVAALYMVVIIIILQLKD